MHQIFFIKTNLCLQDDVIQNNWYSIDMSFSVNSLLSSYKTLLVKVASFLIALPWILIFSGTISKMFSQLSTEPKPSVTIWRIKFLSESNRCKIYWNKSCFLHRIEYRESQNIIALQIIPSILLPYIPLCFSFSYVAF